MRRWLTATVVALGAAASGCSLFVTNAAYGGSWTGKALDQLKRQWGSPSEESVLENGGREVRYELFNGGCTYWFSANDSGKIVAYRYKVNGWGTCKPIG